MRRERKMEGRWSKNLKVMAMRPGQLEFRAAQMEHSK